MNIIDIFIKHDALAEKHADGVHDDLTLIIKNHLL